MTMVINGSGSITGLSAGGLPDATIQPADLSTGGPYWDTSGNVGIGTSSPTAKVQIGDATVVATNRLVFGKAVAASEGNLPAIGQQSATGTGNDLAIAATSTSGVVRFYTGASTNSGEIGTGSNAERARIDSSGCLLVGTTSALGSYTSKVHVLGTGSANDTGIVIQSPVASGGTYAYMERFLNSSGTQVGYISSSGAATSYATSSDYRLKENIAPMTGALSVIQALKPVTYTWKSTGEATQGFIAHELAEIVPECVVGEKDAVDSDGNPEYQGIDTSFLVATLTAALQEQQAMIASQSEIITQLQAQLTSVSTDVAQLKGQA